MPVLFTHFYKSVISIIYTPMVQCAMDFDHERFKVEPYFTAICYLSSKNISINIDFPEPTLPYKYIPVGDTLVIFST